ncbi:MAG: 1-acyl-sn-glycerol-3-phosphate acyltransferase [Endozoicomonas sp.]
MQRFDEIRPYHDHEVRPTLDRLLKDRELLHALARHQFPHLSRNLGSLMEWLTGLSLRRKLRNIHDIAGLQQVIEPYLARVIQSSTSRVSFSGLEQLDNSQAYLYLSNHRDIVMDPAFVNYGIYLNGMRTARIAIGDNLLQRPFVSDLMRLNKSFIVKRSVAGRREKLQSYKTLSAYIKHSIGDRHPVWIAHSEGRAKDGNDQTDSAIIKMLHMSYRSSECSFADDIRAMNIVPVSISFEFDPCDRLKARELYETEKHGEYIKADGEDMQSIVAGIEGYKGHVHIAFGTPLNSDYENAADAVTEVDRQIHHNYRLYPSNLLAWEKVSNEYPDVLVPSLEKLFPEADLDSKRSEFERHLNSCDEKHRHWFLMMYANPVLNRYRQAQ